MNANELTFGVELEVTVPTAARELFRGGSYHCGRQIPVLPTGWESQSDSSIHADADFFGVEVVSPVLKGADGLKQVKLVCDWLTSIGAKVNRSTGLHVHVGFDRRDAKTLKKLVALVARHEKAIYASTGTHSRECGIYCQPIATDAAYVAAFKNGNGRSPSNRYHVLNLVSNQPTVEFRAFAGTTAATKAIGHILTCLGLVQRAFEMKRPAGWDIKADKGGKGDGEYALSRLFGELSWVGNNAKGCGASMIEESLPTLADMKAELVRLAKKYDATV